MKRETWIKYTGEPSFNTKKLTGKLTAWGYGRRGRCVCRLVITGAGISVHSGKKCFRDMWWEDFVKKSSREK